jgi:hypothetical protein
VRAAALLACLASPACAEPVDEWRDLHARCVAAIAGGGAVDVAGLVPLTPHMQRAPARGDLPGAGVLPGFRDPRWAVPEIGGRRLEDAAPDRTRRRVERWRGDDRPLPLEAARRQAEAVGAQDAGAVVPRPGGGAVPRVWLGQGGRFELRVTEYPTRGGFRAACEIRLARGAPPLAAAEAEAVVAAWRAAAAAMPGLGPTVPKTLRPREGVTRLAVDATARNPRGCAIVASLTWDAGRGTLRSAIAETAGVPGCGGRSRTGPAITPHGTRAMEAAR